MHAIKRREFMALAAAAGASSILPLPLPASAQTQPLPVTKHVGVLWTLAQNDHTALAREKSLLAWLASAGLGEQKKITKNNRWGLTDARQWRTAVAQLIAANVDAIVTDT